MDTGVRRYDERLLIGDSPLLLPVESAIGRRYRISLETLHVLLIANNFPGQQWVKNGIHQFLFRWAPASAGVTVLEKGG
jgi:hypothetical protein